MLQLLLGTIVSVTDRARLMLVESLLFTHLIVFGGTRSGKSKLFEHICRLLIMNGRGLAWIDPHGDTADDLLRYLAFFQKKLGLVTRKIHYWNLNDRLICFDPFVYHPDPDDPESGSEFHYRCWLTTKIKDMVNIIIRQQGETEDEKSKMVRLQRWLTNGLYAVGVRQDKTGTHYPLHYIFILLNPNHPRHNELYERVAPHLNDQIRADFEKLRATKDPRKQEDWIESTVNRLRNFLTPLVQQIFTTDRPSIDFHQIIMRGEIILASLGKTRRFHEDEALTIAGLIIREITEAVRTVPRDKRQRYYLFLDEAQNFLNDDLLTLLKESGKYKLVCGMAVQSLDNLRKGENLDLVPAVLGQCGVRITFRQGYFDHAETLAKSLMYGLLDFKPLEMEVDRDDGYDWVLVPSVTVGHSKATAISQSRTVSHSRSIGVGKNWSRSITLGTAETVNHSQSIGQTNGWSIGTGETLSLGWAETASQQHTDSENRSTSQSKGTSSTRSDSDNISDGSGVTHTPSGAIVRHENDGNSSGRSQSQGENSSSSEQTGSGISNAVGNSSTRNGSKSASSTTGQNGGLSKTETSGEGNTVSRSKSRTTGGSITETETRGESITEGESQTDTENESLSLSPTPLHKTRAEVQKSGKLETAINDQVARQTVDIMSLDAQHCIISIAAFHSSFHVRVADVCDPFADAGSSPQWIDKIVQHFKEKIFAMHKYFFSYQEVEAISDETPKRLPQKTDDDGLFA